MTIAFRLCCLTLSLMAASLAQPLAAQNPLVFYDFENQSVPGTIFDTSGNGRNGTYQNGAAPVGSAAFGNFAGSTNPAGPAQYIDIGTAGFNLGNQFTIASFIKGGNNGDLQIVYSNAVLGSVSGVYFGIENRGAMNGQIKFGTHDGGGGYNEAHTADNVYVHSTTEWRSIVATVDRLAGTAALYYEGAPVALVDSTIFNNFGTTAPSGHHLGVVPGGLFWTDFDFDNFQIYNRILTPQEIARLDLTGTAVPEPSSWAMFTLLGAGLGAFIWFRGRRA